MVAEGRWLEDAGGRWAGRLEAAGRPRAQAVPQPRGEGLPHRLPQPVGEGEAALEAEAEADSPPTFVGSLGLVRPCQPPASSHSGWR